MCGRSSRRRRCRIQRRRRVASAICRACRQAEFRRLYTMLYTDTIAAIATPVGEGGIGIVRLSGPDALPILRRLFRPRRDAVGWRPQQMRYGWLVDQTGATIDEGLAVYFQAPHSYTREDVV